MPTKIVNPEMDQLTDSYRLEDFLTAHYEGKTAPVIETPSSIEEWKNFFTNADIPWAAFVRTSNSNSHPVNVIWKIVDKTPEPKIIWKK